MKTAAPVDLNPPKWQDVLPDRPDGWFTIREYAASHQIEYRTAVSRLTEMVRRGQLVVARYRAENAIGKICALNCYSAKGMVS